MSTVDEDDLYSLPIQGFTEARNSLAARLKQEGDDDGAARVKALKKPSVAAWAVNQLVRDKRLQVDELLRLRDDIEGASSAPELRTLTERRRKLLTSLVAEARRILEQGGHAPSAGTVEKISQTLLAASDEGARERLLTGTLERELLSTTTAFGAFGSFDAATATFDEVDEPDPHLERLKAEADDADADAARLERLAEEAQTEADAARDRAVQARRAADRAREKAEKAGA